MGRLIKGIFLEFNDSIKRPPPSLNGFLYIFYFQKVFQHLPDAAAGAISILGLGIKIEDKDVVVSLEH